MSLLEVDGLRSGYGRSEVIHGVDLRVPAGSAVALLGANGAGKSTLLKSLAGLVQPSAGRIGFRGEDVTRWPPHRRSASGLCLIPEGRAIFRRLTVRENLAMQVGGRDLRGAIRQVTAMFPRLGDRLGQVAGTLSGGEQQMLALARALLTDPALVLADELSVGLAPVLVDEIFDAVTALRAQGRSLLIVEQYVQRVLGLADYVYLLHKGKVVFVGEPSQCQENDLFAQYAGVAV
jgi:branched-chain amino acid transport system ATP-binding protein